MKRLLMFTFIALFALGSMAFATETRVLTMGDANNIVKDEANIWIYPSTINFYPDVFYGEFGGDSYYYAGKDYGMDYNFRKAGLHMKFGEDNENPFVLGVYLSDQPYYHDILYSYGYGYGYWDKDVYYGTASHKIDLFFGWYLSEIPWGFHIGYYGESMEYESEYWEDDQYEESVSRYEFSFGGTLMEGKLDLGLGVAFTSWTDKYWDDSYTDAMADMTEPDGNMDFYLSVRYFTDPIGRLVFVPHFGFWYSKQAITQNDYDGDSWAAYYNVEWKQTAFDLGVGTNYNVTDDILIVTDFGFQYWKESDDYSYPDYPDWISEEDYSWTTLPYFHIGMDAKIFNWLDFRAGAKTWWDMYKYEYTYQYDEESDVHDETYKHSYASTDFYLGVGFNWNNLTLDCTLDSEFLEQGPYFISGDNEVDEMFERITLKYNF